MIEFTKSISKLIKMRAHANHEFLAGQNVKISNQPSQRESFELIARARFYQFAKQHRNPLINFLYNERLRRILRMICSEVDENNRCKIMLDVGCGKARFSCVLSLKFTTIGLDVNKSKMQKGYRKLDRLNLIVADMDAMPLKDHSVDIVVCASVLEHCKNLESSLVHIRRVLKKDGFLIVGYPVETTFFKSILKRVSPSRLRFIDQSQTCWCNPFTKKREYYWDSPHTHKQTYQTIRSTLRRTFEVLQIEKLPLKFLPDRLTYYECIKMRNEI